MALKSSHITMNPGGSQGWGLFAPSSPVFLQRNLRLMQARRSQFKSTTIKKAPTDRSGRFRRSFRVRRRRSAFRAAGGAGGDKPWADPTCTKLNIYAPPPTMFKRTVGGAFTLAVSTGGAISVVFDPSGSYSLYQGSSTAAIAGVADWASLKAIYNQYRVRKVVMHWKFVTSGATVSSLDDDSVIMLERYNYEKAVTTPTLAGMIQLQNVQRKVFTAQHPVHTYTVYPKAMKTLENTGILSAQGLGIADMPWTNCESPCELFGYQFAFETSSNAYTTGQLDIEYDLEMRYNK